MRFGLENSYVRLLLKTSVAEYNDLSLEIWTQDLQQKIQETSPEPRADLLGLHEATVMLSKGFYFVHWTASQPERVDVWDELLILAEPSAFPSHSVHSVGENFYPVFPSNNFDNVTFDLYLVGQSVMPIIRGGSAHSAEDRFYVADEPYIFTEPGTYLIIWFSNGSEIGYQVLDVFTTLSAIAVTFAFYQHYPNQPYGSGWVILTNQIHPEKVKKLKISESGTVGEFLERGVYWVTIYDGPNRIFSQNNWILDLRREKQQNITVSYNVKYIDITTSDLTEISPDKIAIMHVNILIGPEGLPLAYREIIVVQDTVYAGDLIIAPGKKTYYLDANGKADIALVRNSKVTVIIPAAHIKTSFTVPDVAEFYLTDVESSDNFTIQIPRVYTPTKITI